jgi:uncharacterized protein (TIGR02186 family)
MSARLVLAVLASLAATLAADAMAQAPSSAPSLQVDLSRPRVAITSAFRGGEILIYGAFDQPGDVVITVSGPPLRQVVQRRERILGVWLIGARQSFDNVPGYYAVASTAPIDKILPAGGLGEMLTLDERLAAAKPSFGRPPAELAAFKKGLVEAKRRLLLYPDDTPAVQMNQRLFRLDLPLPSAITVGDYDIRAYLVRDGQIVAAVSRPLVVSKAGFSARVSEWARGEAPLYALGAILFALGIGWAGGALMRRF